MHFNCGCSCVHGSLNAVIFICVHYITKLYYMGMLDSVIESALLLFSVAHSHPDEGVSQGRL